MVLLAMEERRRVIGAKHAHTATASYASRWGKTKEIRFESE
jgi:hypothetical protein